MKYLPLPVGPLSIGEGKHYWAVLAFFCLCRSEKWERGLKARSSLGSLRVVRVTLRNGFHLVCNARRNGFRLSRVLS